MTLTLPTGAQIHRSFEDLSPFSVIHEGIRPFCTEPDFTLRWKEAFSHPCLPGLSLTDAGSSACTPMRPCVTSWKLQE